MTASYPVFGISSGGALASFLLFGGAALVALIYCIVVARRVRAPWPLAAFGGSALLVTYEPFNNFLAHCAYPTGPHAHDMLTWFGQHVPWTTWLIYMFYFSFAVPLLVQKLDRGVTMRGFFGFYACAVVICAAFEPIFANVHGLRWWYYYGDNQALAFTGMPMFWWFANAMVVVGTGVAVYLLKRHVFTRPAQQWLIVPLSPLLLFALHGSASAPVFTAIHSTNSVAISTLATLLTIAISILYIWLMGAACQLNRTSAHPSLEERVRELASV